MSGVALDSAAFEGPPGVEEAIAQLKRRFPSVVIVFIQRPQLDPITLFRLGRIATEGLALVHRDELPGGMTSALSRVAGHTTEGRVVRAIGPRLPLGELSVVRRSLRGAQLGWSADDLAARAGLSRAHLSKRLRERSLPSAGHLLIWAKVLHAGRWLVDPGRSAESVSRQLDYSSGAAFRRVLHNYLGVTPTGLKSEGGLAFALAAFLDECDLGDSLGGDLSVA